jgi:hypothetical protein
MIAHSTVSGQLASVCIHREWIRDTSNRDVLQRLGHSPPLRDWKHDVLELLVLFDDVKKV